MFKLLTFVLMVAISIDCTYETYPHDENSAFLNGDFIIGALLPLHHQPATKDKRHSQGNIKCGRIRELYGIQRAEVALQTIDKINNDATLLKNITLGIEIRDDCWFAPKALQQSIELIRDAITPSSANNCVNTTHDTFGAKKQRGHLIGVVGPGSSSIALQVQNLLQLFHLPQVGYSTTSKDLSDKSRFSYFVRVVPSDYYQAQVMLDIVKYFGWTYVSAVNTDENYGQSGIQAFRELAEEADVCIAREDSVLSTAAEEAFDKVILNLKQDRNANVVVCFCEGLTVRGLLSATRRLNMSDHFLFIGSDGWADRGDVTQGLDREAWGSISVRIHSPYVKDFDAHYWSLRPATNKRNPWFNEFWEDRFECKLRPSPSPPLDNLTTYKKECTGEEDLSAAYRQDSKLSFVIKAIYALAYALDNMQQDVCGHHIKGFCEKLLPFNGSLFKSYLTNVSFDFDGDQIEFDENGDPPGRYDIMNYQRLHDRFDYIRIGDWNNKSLVWDRSTQIQLGPKDEIKSVCSQECPLGHYKNIQQGGKDKRCCWVCVRCPHGEIFDATTNCKRCNLGRIPDLNQTECLLLPIVYTQWNDTESIIALSIGALGFTTTWFTLIVFVKYNNTPVVKSSTRELSYIILAGMSLSHFSVLPIIAKPHVVTCALTRFLPGLSFAMIYAALLTKTNRIARILTTSKKDFPSLQKNRFMTSGSQVLITLCLISVEVLIALWMLHKQPANVAEFYSEKHTMLGCNTTPEGVLTPLVFDFFLILLCTLYAAKTRNVPENFNEAKFIGFAVYTTCVIWVAFIPIYFGSEAKVITLCLSVTLTAIITWLFLFVPKLYIIILHPERNNRAFFTTTSKSIRCHFGGSKVSSIKNDVAADNKLEKLSGKRTLSCQTGVELLQQILLLNPRNLMIDTTNTRFVPEIIEKNCCEAENCEFKKIVIRIPDTSSNV